MLNDHGFMPRHAHGYKFDAAKPAEKSYRLLILEARSCSYLHQAKGVANALPVRSEKKTLLLIGPYPQIFPTEAAAKQSLTRK